MSLSRWRFGALFASGITAMLLVACSGSSAQPEPATPAPDTPTPSPTVLPTPRPTSTALPVVEEPAASGSVTATLNVVCYEGDYGLEVRVRYGARIRDTDDPRATITRVRIYMDGTLRQDSGPLSHRIYVREAFLGGIPARVHSVQIRIDTWAAPKPNDIVQFASCPPASGEPVAQVVN